MDNHHIRRTPRTRSPVQALELENNVTGLEGLEHHDVLEQTIGVKPGDHICVLYDYSPLERLPEVLPFLKEGLESGEQCIYVSDEIPAANLEDWFRAYGMDVSKLQARQALLFWTREEWRQPGPLDAIKKAAQVQQIIEWAFAAGFLGVRFAVEMTWTRNPDIPAESMREWEVKANELLGPGAPVRVMCLYGRRRLSRQAVAAGISSHPLLLDAKGLRENEAFRPASAKQGRRDQGDSQF